MNAMMKNCRLQENAPPPTQLKVKAHIGTRASVVVDKVLAMKRREASAYLYNNYLQEPRVQPPKCLYEESPEGDVSVWREEICHWTFGVIDHFNLSRKTVAISISMFDRYLATQGNCCDGRHALLVSLTTLYIAIKVHEQKKMKLSTLSELSRNQFECRDIEVMEIKIMQAISWLVHPPIAVDYTSLLLKFLPPSVPMPIRHRIFEHSRYMSELSVCDPVFIKYHQSTIAFASIINVLENDMSPEYVSLPCRHRYYRYLYEELGFHRDRSVVRFACDRLQTMVAASGAAYGANKENAPSLSRPRTATGTKEVNWNKADDYSMSSTIVTFDSAKSKIMKSPNHSRCSSVDSRNSLGSIGSAAGRLFHSRKGLLVTPC